MSSNGFCILCLALSLVLFFFFVVFFVQCASYSNDCRTRAGPGPSEKREESREKNKDLLNVSSNYIFIHRAFVIVTIV